VFCFRYEFARAVRGRGELAGVNALNADERALIPPRKGYARLTRIEFETIYSAAEGA
jgi:hypothetical protein